MYTRRIDPKRIREDYNVGMIAAGTIEMVGET
jgi:hypothetical protein